MRDAISVTDLIIARKKYNYLIHLFVTYLTTLILTERTKFHIILNSKPVNTLRTGSFKLFKLFKLPFPGFLTILTL